MNDAAEAPQAPLTLFTIPFVNVMHDGGLTQLSRTLGLSTRMHPKMLAAHQSPGLLRLDHHSGLFLERGSQDGHWTLEARTWGHPSARAVHEWRVLATGAAHQLDASVIAPARLDAEAADVPNLRVGRASNRRFADLRRRLANGRDRNLAAR